MEVPPVPVKQEVVPEQEAEAAPEDKTQLMRTYYSDAQKAFTQKKYKEAIAGWQKVLEMDPNHEQSKRMIARAQQLDKPAPRKKNKATPAPAAQEPTPAAETQEVPVDSTNP
jgi:hypothetical protein